MCVCVHVCNSVYSFLINSSPYSAFHESYERHVIDSMYIKEKQTG